ncbi:MAG: hypothetical protein ACXVB9_18590 [Bdellovibrionota bacterium]
MSRAPLILAFSLLTLPALAATTAKQKEMKPTADMTAPEGFVLVEDFVTVDLKQLPIDLLNSAQADFGLKNYGETAAGLRAAARVFRLEAKQAAGENGRHHLFNAADDLEKLANSVKSESIKSTEAFHDELAKALYHDASFHQQLAQSEWDKKAYHRAGDDLRASAVAADLASKWSSSKDLATANKAAVDKARDVAMHLTTNEGWTAQDVRDALTRLDLAVADIGEKVMPSSDRSKASDVPSGI